MNQIYQLCVSSVYFTVRNVSDTIIRKSINIVHESRHGEQKRSPSEDEHVILGIARTTIRDPTHHRVYYTLYSPRERVVLLAVSIVGRDTLPYHVGRELARHQR